MPNPIAQSIAKQAQSVLVTGQRFKRFDQIRQRHFWSTYRFIADSNSYVMPGDFDVFTIPIGQKGQGFGQALSLLETNWPGINRIADNQNLEVTELGVSCKVRLGGGAGFANTLVNSPNYHGVENEILQNTSLAITYLTNSVPLGMCTDFAQASGPEAGQYAPNMPQRLNVVGHVEGEEIESAAAYPAYPNDDIGRNLVTNGFAAPSLRRKFTIPILLQHGETFKFTLSISPGRGPWIWPAYGAPDGLPYQPQAIDLRVDFWATESFVEKS